MVSAPLVRLCFTRGDNPHSFISESVRDNEQVALHHAEKDQALLAIILAVVHKVDGERIIKGIAGLLEAHTVLGEIGSSLCIILFEVV